MENLPTILFNAENRTLQFKLMDSQGENPINLTGMTLQFNLGDSATTPIIQKTMSITSALLGECEVVLTPTELTNLGSGRFRYNIRQTAPSNRVLVFGNVQIFVTF